jgi:hypothetical protein
MPITVEFREDTRIIIASMIGNLTAEEIAGLLKNTLDDFIKRHSPERVDMIFDVRQFEWDFQQFVKYLSLAKERRNTEGLPPNLVQHFVGQNEWIQNFRTWLGNRFGTYYGTFLTLEDALSYIENQKSKISEEDT